MANDFYNSPWRPDLSAKIYPTRVISGTRILELGNGIEQEQKIIGYTCEYFTDMETALGEALDKAECYYSRLVELGDIVPEKTPEELLREQNEAQAAINAQLLETVQALSAKVDELGKKEPVQLTVLDTKVDEPAEPEIIETAVVKPKPQQYQKKQNYQQPKKEVVS